MVPRALGYIFLALCIVFCVAVVWMNNVLLNEALLQTEIRLQNAEAQRDLYKRWWLGCESKQENPQSNSSSAPSEWSSPLAR